MFLEQLKKDKVGNALSVFTAIMLVFSLAFYTAAIRNNFHPLFIVFGVLAAVLFISGTILPTRGVCSVLGAGLTAFCFGFFLIGRIESINFIQVNLSDINMWFYVEMVFISISLVSALVTSFVKKS